jgi:hypothetical protein
VIALRTTNGPLRDGRQDNPSAMRDTSGHFGIVTEPLTQSGLSGLSALADRRLGHSPGTARGRTRADPDGERR